APPAAERDQTAARPGPRLAAFTAFAAFAAVEYSTLLLHPPTLRVLGAVALAAVGGAALASLGGRSPARRIARWIVPLAMLIALIAVLGVPLHLLPPWRWGSLTSNVREGIDGLEGWLWPYRGGSRWARLAVLLPLAPALTLASAVCLWPAPRSVWRELIALGTLIAVLMCGLVNQHAPAWRVQGFALVLLVCAWLWLAWLPGRRVNRALAWVLAASVGALLLAPALSSSEPWLDYRSWDPVPSEISFQWNQTYGPITWSRSAATVLTVSEHRPSLLKLIALDRFDGVAFVRSSTPPGAARLDLPSPRSQLVARNQQSVTVTVAGLRAPQLVTGGGAPEHVEWLSGRSAPVTVTADGVLSLPAAPSAGTRYRISSYAPSPSPAVLRAAPRAYPRRYLPYAAFAVPGPPPHAGLLRLRAGVGGALLVPPAPGVSPASVPAMRARLEGSPYAGAFALARRLAAAEPNPYDVAARIDEYLRAHYRYNERPPLTSYPLESFLTGSAGGYCQQFSGAMALLLRLDGIPARVAEGFAPGTFDAAQGRWTIRALDAHAWVEVYFAGVGWVPFDPTPPQPGEGLTGAGLGALNRGVAAPAVASSPAASRPLHTRPQVARAVSRHRSSDLALLLAIALGAVLALATGLLCLVGRRRLRASLAGDAEGAVAELGAALVRLRVPVSPGSTLDRLAQSLQDGEAPAAARYARLLAGARYEPAPTARATLRDRRACRRELAALAGGNRAQRRRRPIAALGARARALLALPPLLARADSSTSGAPSA
ncbi:MAG TPA: transglutaminase domain-containing protein, partial [Solirubrobacteraceae bacterium]|nr:transglutaminase domain-containing protein [Solirubrobacteraceae bacterium]